MRKSELINLFAEATGQPTRQAAEDLEKLGDIMAAELLAGGEVPIPRVGKLVIVQRKARTCRNLKTGDPVEVPARKQAVLKMGKELKEALV